MHSALGWSGPSITISVPQSITKITAHWRSHPNMTIVLHTGWKNWKEEPYRWKTSAFRKLPDVGSRLSSRVQIGMWCMYTPRSCCNVSFQTLFYRPSCATWEGASVTSKQRQLFLWGHITIIFRDLLDPSQVLCRKEQYTKTRRESAQPETRSHKTDRICIRIVNKDTELRINVWQKLPTRV